MQQKLQALKSEAIEALNNATAVDMLNDLRVKYLGKKGEITTILRGLGALSPEERPLVGQLVNEVHSLSTIHHSPFTIYYFLPVLPALRLTTSPSYLTPLPL